MSVFDYQLLFSFLFTLLVLVFWCIFFFYFISLISQSHISCKNTMLWILTKQQFIDFAQNFSIIVSDLYKLQQFLGLKLVNCGLCTVFYFIHVGLLQICSVFLMMTPHYFASQRLKNQKALTLLLPSRTSIANSTAGTEGSQTYKSTHSFIHTPSQVLPLSFFASS